MGNASTADAGFDLYGKNINNDARMEAMQMANDMKMRMMQERASMGGGDTAGGATGVLVNRLMKENPSMSFGEALHKVQTGFRTGVDYSPTGGIAPMPNALETREAFKQAEETGKGRGDNAAKLEAAQPAKARLSGIIAEAKKKYQTLDEQGGIVNTNRSTADNLAARASSTMVGQAIGGAVGTKNQSIRNDILAMEPVLMSQMMAATGLSATQLNSNAELEFYRAAVRGGDIASAMNAMDRIDKMYGAPAEGGKQPAAGVGADKPKPKFLGYE
jgi:hypothetical protein